MESSLDFLSLPQLKALAHGNTSKCYPRRRAKVCNAEVVNALLDEDVVPDENIVRSCH
jgi:hypothetical protein